MGFYNFIRGGKTMNEIEKKYWDSFKNYIFSNPTIEIFNNTLQAKIKILFNEELPSDDITNNMIEFVASIETKDYSLKDVSLMLASEKRTISGYKPDFIITSLTDECFGEFFTVEIDGYEWHEKTKEQAANDRKKDRAYLKNNYTPIRFLGTEVYHDPLYCVKETLDIVFHRLIFCADNINRFFIYDKNIKKNSK